MNLRKCDLTEFNSKVHSITTEKKNTKESQFRISLELFKLRRRMQKGKSEKG